MTRPPLIVRFTAWPPSQIDPLIRESEAEGFRFLKRLRDDWLSGANEFSAPGEAFFGVFDGDTLIAVGGINRVSDDTGRLRRFYVKPAARRRGIGRLLVRHLLEFAARHYTHVVLHTDTAAADRIYQALGFTRLVDSQDPTHCYRFGTTHE